MMPNIYSDYGPKWCEVIIDALNGTAFDIGIASDRKQRGESVNCAVMDHDEAQGLFVLQVRQCRFRPGRYNRVRKDYFLCGRNENGNAFAHPVDVIATNARVQVALCRIWQVTPSQLPHIVRQGDVAVIPERGVTFKDVEPLAPITFTIDSNTASHHLYSRCAVRASRWPFLRRGVGPNPAREESASFRCRETQPRQTVSRAGWGTRADVGVCIPNGGLVFPDLWPCPLMRQWAWGRLGDSETMKQVRTKPNAGHELKQGTGDYAFVCSCGEWRLTLEASTRFDGIQEHKLHIRAAKARNRRGLSQ